MQDAIEIATAQGRVCGVVNDGVAVFRGVPFAAAPVGPLRFQPPAPAPPRSDVLDATSAAAVCPQLPSRLAALMGDFEAAQDESCLTVDIWSPQPLNRSRPVLVWLHGGGYLSGGGSLAWYDGARLARENDIVVVNINYRVGALGYLYRPGLSSGNMGLLDQVQAIRWIKENAAALGGDPSQVTLMGQSAGSHSILCMLATAERRSLARRVILLSAPFGMRTLVPEEAAASAALLCEQLGIDPDHTEALQQLQSTPVERILEAQIAVLRNPARAVGDPTPPFGPTALGGLPSGSEFDAAITAGARGIEAIVGTTADEAAAFYALDPRLRDLNLDGLPPVAEGLFGATWSDRISWARRRRPGATAFEALCDAQTAHYFAEGAEQFARSVANGGGKAWLYRFDWSAPNSGFGACHCVELPFVFGTFEAFEKAPMLGGVDEKKRALSDVVRGAFGRFAATGAPDGADLPEWRPFTFSDPALLTFDEVIRTGRADLNGRQGAAACSQG